VRTDSFRYELPSDRIAQTPTEPRDKAKLLDARTGVDHVVRALPELLKPGDLVVVNDTKVRAARLRGKRVPSGGEIEILLLDRFTAAGWTALVKPARRLRAGDVVEFPGLSATLTRAPQDGMIVIVLTSTEGRDIEEVISEVGEMPLPPYIHTRLENPDRYQTTYAKTVGSAAAPTAGLHLSNEVFEGLEDRNIGLASIELRVGVGTFRTISDESIETHQMHDEWTSVSTDTVEAVNSTKASGGRIVAIGTTVVRALETGATSVGLGTWEGQTDLYITPGYRFEIVDLLMTNFHVPGSSLLVMIAAFMGDAWRDVYKMALSRDYRFLSFGDAMLAELDAGAWMSEHV